MKKRCASALLAAGLLVLVACGDGFTGLEPARGAEDPAPAALPVPVEAIPTPGAEVEALELSADLRSTMTRTLTAALAELDLQPDLPMSLLHDFFQEVEAQQAERLPARAALPETLQP